MLERYREGTTVVNFEEIGRQQCQRLEQEGATKRSLGFIKHVFDLAAQNPRSSPINFLL
jgi:hypothetical protein